ncbi:TadE family type IV pilus minor pilin [Microbacterium sp. NIBRBAC000506063]|uniref:TadE family type IV pilus minor pilin n=1 Tax=Microbacterium sp. NIBRBAC000506063 TaxID=2734618 RepID=UPI001BB5BDF9|nr:TadE family type IV pilus minor pilin [Microbacterium sp. NIBRBAC000506063]QTV80042.1 pilus assembly protein [Microbacterium sp. NIBRBAC000506063]
MSARDEAGSVAAEFAVALPVVVLTLLLGVGALSAASTQVALQDAVSDAARLLGRGESDARVRETVSASVAGAQLSAARQHGLVCVTGRVDLGVGRLVQLPLRARGCALDGGW